MFETREIATILAALLFWSEEISPNCKNTAECYLKSVRMPGVEPLTVDEIKRLSARIRKMRQTE